MSFQRVHFTLPSICHSILLIHLWNWCIDDCRDERPFHVNSQINTDCNPVKYYEKTEWKVNRKFVVNAVTRVHNLVKYIWMHIKVLCISRWCKKKYNMHPSKSWSTWDTVEETSFWSIWFKMQKIKMVPELRPYLITAFFISVWQFINKKSLII